MKPVDIKGRPIYSRIFGVLQKYGEKMVALHWSESYNKPNLFYKSFNEIMVFADMRGTEIVPIWDEPYPYIYDNGKSEEEWKRRRSINKAIAELNSVNIPHRFSFYEDCEPDGLFFGDEQDLADGICKMCKKEFDHSGLFCSEECEKNQLEKEKKAEEEYLSETKAQKSQTEMILPKKRKVKGASNKKSTSKL